LGVTDTIERAALVRELQAMARSLWISQAIYAAVDLGLADTLRGRPRKAPAVAAEIGVEPGPLARLMGALVTLGVLTRSNDGRFALTAMGSLLCAGEPDSVRSSVLLTGPAHRRAWGELGNCVRTGQHAAKLLDGLDDPFAVFDSPELQDGFNRAMAEGTRRIAETVVEAYDFAGIARLVDVGGGYGAFVPPVLAAFPAMTAVVFDLPHCALGASELALTAGVAGRCRFVAGDFFADPLPSGAGAYLVKSVVHDWDDRASVAILGACRRAASSDSRLLVVEVVLPDRLDTSSDHRSMVAADLNMLVNTGGLERTGAQYRDLLDRAGWTLCGIVPTASGLSVLEATPGP
jgi:hypothetical protein